MKKSHPHTDLSSILCPQCGRQIKKRLATSDRRRLCFECHCKREASRGHFMCSSKAAKELVKEGSMRKGKRHP